MFDAAFDRQKLSYHPREVSSWLTTGNSQGPIYTEMELSSRCNCQCMFCGVDHVVNKSSVDIGLEDAKRIISDLEELGNKSVMFCGHGEPLLNPACLEVIRFASERMNTSVTTNGLLLTEENIGLIDGLDWIRFSVNGTSPDNYAWIHGIQSNAFEKVLGSISLAVRRKQSLGLLTTIGVQLVLLNENAAGLLEFAKRLKQVGVDYFSVKPYSRLLNSGNSLTVDYESLCHYGDKLQALENEQFRIIFRESAMARVKETKPYRTCYGTDFMCFISANGDVWECNDHVGDSRFMVGNAIVDRLPRIWSGRRRKEVLHNHPIRV